MQIEFYHTFKIPELGIDIQGQWDHNPHKALFRKHFNISGKTVLDVACRDGWFSLLFEEMGAKSVTAIDVDDRHARQYVFNKKRSSTIFKQMNVYSLINNPCPEKAQVVFTGDLICHLLYPILALEGMHNACDECCYFACDVSPKTLVGRMDYPNSWIREDLINVLKLAQFEKIDILDQFVLHGEYWKQRGCWPYDRQVVLIRCEKNPNFIPPNLEETVPESINALPELTREVDWDESSKTTL